MPSAIGQGARTLRAAQCREGWHLEAEPVIDPDPATEDQRWWVEKRAEAQAMRDQADADGEDVSDLDELTGELDQEINASGMRGNVLPARPVRRHRTTGAARMPRCCCHQPTNDAQHAHAERLADALRYEPCSPRCANWLRYGIQPKNARPGLVPGACRGKAHWREHLGYAGRRVLVSRKWPGNTLADHRADRRNWLLTTLGQTATDPARYAWEPVVPGDPDHMEHARRLLHVVADRQRWRAALAEARRRAGIQPPADLSATGRAA